jgi:hypothetical protein
MRGREKKVTSYPLTGRVFLAFSNEYTTNLPLKGDLLLYRNTDMVGAAGVVQGEYTQLGHAGYFRADIYDGNEWQHIDLDEFMEDRVHHFSKKERPLDVFLLLKPLLEAFKSTPVYRSYRNHYTLHLHVPGIYKGRKGQQ